MIKYSRVVSLHMGLPRALELIRVHFATIEYKQALHKMSSNSDNQRQRRLNGDSNSKCNGLPDDGSRSAGERSLVWKSCNNSQEHLKSSEKCRNTPTRAEEQSVQRMAKPAVCIKRNHFQTVCTPKEKAHSQNTSRLDENKVYDDQSSARDENHTFSLSTWQSSKNQPLF